MARNSEAAASAGKIARLRVRSIRSDEGEFRNFPGRQRDDFPELNSGLHDQRHTQVVFEQVLAGGKARGRLNVIRQSRGAKNDGIGGFLRANPGTAFHPALAKRARQAQYARQGADVILLLQRKLRERTALCAGFGPAMVANGKSQKLPFLDRKSTRLNSSHVAISYAV